MLKPGPASQLPIAAAEAASRGRGTIEATYSNALRGFAITMPRSSLPQIADQPDVAYIEPDQALGLQSQRVPTGVGRTFGKANATIGIDGADDRRVDVDVAVIDTGIDASHPDLNVVAGVTCLGAPDGSSAAGTASCMPGGHDDHYHGTHMAGIIGALDNGIGVVGIAPGARLWAVKVLDAAGDGTVATALAGLDWVVANAATIEVANISLGASGYSKAFYDGIQRAVDAGIALAGAAGNGAGDASRYSPAAFDNILTVSALADFDGAPGGRAEPTCRPDQDDTLADFSNWGSAIDLAAPGMCIRSTFPVARGSYDTLSGTSAAAPHVAGGLALLASADPPESASDVAGLYRRIRADGNFDWTDDSGDGVQEPLLDVRALDAVTIAGPENGPEHPTPDFGGLVPARLLDTRPGYPTSDGLAAGQGPLPAGGALQLRVAGRGGVPADAAAVALTVTATRPARAGHITAHPAGTGRPLASNLNYQPGQTVANTVIVPIGTDGSITLATSATTHLIADINGYFPADSDFGGLVPARLLDTRPGYPTSDGLAAGQGPLPAGGALQLRVAGRGGVPADAAAVALTVTATRPAQRLLRRPVGRTPGHVAVTAALGWRSRGAGDPLALGSTLAGPNAAVSAVCRGLGVAGAGSRGGVAGLPSRSRQQVCTRCGGLHPVPASAPGAGVCTRCRRLHPVRGSAPGAGVCTRCGGLHPVPASAPGAGVCTRCGGYRGRSMGKLAPGLGVCTRRGGCRGRNWLLQPPPRVQTPGPGAGIAPQTPVQPPPRVQTPEPGAEPRAQGAPRDALAH